MATIMVGRAVLPTLTTLVTMALRAFIANTTIKENIVINVGNGDSCSLSTNGGRSGGIRVKLLGGVE